MFVGQTPDVDGHQLHFLSPQYSVMNEHSCLEGREGTLCYCLCRSNVCSLSSRVVSPSHREDQSAQPWAMLHCYRYSWCQVFDHMQSWACLGNTWVCYRLYLMLTALGLYIYFIVLFFFNHKCNILYIKYIYKILKLSQCKFCIKYIYQSLSTGMYVVYM